TGVVSCTGASLGDAMTSPAGVGSDSVTGVPPHEASTTALVSRTARTLTAPPSTRASRPNQNARRDKRIADRSPALDAPAAPALAHADPHQRALERRPGARLFGGVHAH